MQNAQLFEQIKRFICRNDYRVSYSCYLRLQTIGEVGLYVRVVLHVLHKERPPVICTSYVPGVIAGRTKIPFKAPFLSHLLVPRRRRDDVIEQRQCVS